VLAVAAVSYSAVDIRIPGLVVLRLAIGLLSTIGVAAAIGMAAVRLRANASSFAIWISMAAVIALAPLAVDSAVDIDRMDVSLLALAVVAAIYMAALPGVLVRLLTAVVIAMACATCPAALAWALAVLWRPGRAWHGSGGHRSGIIVTLSSMAGIAVGWWAGWWRPAIHNATARSDLIVLLPVVAVGLAGVGGRWPFRWRSLHGQPAWLALWCGLSSLGLVLVICGLPLDLRVLVLPFWFAMPWGLGRLWEVCRASACGRVLALVCCIALGFLCLPAAGRMLDAALKIVFVIQASY
jgi:hypothetical protein